MGMHGLKTRVMNNLLATFCLHFMKTYQYYTWQQRKLFTISLFVLEASAALLSSVKHFVCVNSELRSMVRELVPQTNYYELRSWTLWTCGPSAHPEAVFYQLSKCSLRL